MLPPDFIKHLEGGGKDPPHCMVCARAGDFERELVCMEYRAYVLLYSSCKSFERKEKGLPVINIEEVNQKFASGLIDMRGGKR
jgi:hypothetical protein